MNTLIPSHNLPLFSASKSYWLDPGPRGKDSRVLIPALMVPAQVSRGRVVCLFFRGAEDLPLMSVGGGASAPMKIQTLCFFLSLSLL